MASLSPLASIHDLASVAKLRLEAGELRVTKGFKQPPPEPGTTILIAPGEDSSGLHFRGISGSAEATITVKGAYPNDLPVWLRGV